MARIAGVNIPQNKVVKTALTYIHGIGDKTANKLIFLIYGSYSWGKYSSK